MTFQRLQELIAAYRDGRLTDPELEELSGILRQDFPAEWDSIIRQTLQSQPDKLSPENDLELWEQIIAGRKVIPIEKRRFSLKKPVWAAAIAVIVCLTGYLIWIPASRQHAITQSQKRINAIEPATNGAILTLEDGTKLVLDSLGNGVIANQAGANLTLQNGALIYDALQGRNTVAYNTLQTPKGRQFNIRLPDGSRVWLNAASTIKYPVAFSQNERRVEVDGEAYFEIAHDHTKPFIVNVRQVAEVKVIGTHFNVNAYNDETALATTLLSGVVEIHSLHASPTEKPVRMLPGQQARLGYAHDNIQLIPADTSQVMAWKNGVFDFNGASLQQVMRQIARWYDLTIEYEEGAPAMSFGGKMGRNLKLADVLEFLKGARVNFTMKEDRKLIVLPVD